MCDRWPRGSTGICLTPRHRSESFVPQAVHSWGLAVALCLGKFRFDGSAQVDLRLDVSLSGPAVSHCWWLNVPKCWLRSDAAGNSSTQSKPQISCSSVLCLHSCDGTARVLPFVVSQLSAQEAQPIGGAPRDPFQPGRHTAAPWLFGFTWETRKSPCSFRDARGTELVSFNAPG